MVVVLALFIGLRAPLTDAPQPPAEPETTASPRQSTDDDGFSITLTRPGEPYLVGRQEVTIETIVPSGDAIAQVDFFVDGRLAHTDREAPYVAAHDFGDEIRRHTIIVTALTREGRRAKVSFVSRAATLSGATTRPFAIVPVVVRDAQGKRAERLSVSDFILIENGARQPIVHFDADPAPLAVGLILLAPAGPAARNALVRQAAAMLDALPAYHTFAFLDAGREAPPRPAAPRPAALREPAAAPPPAAFTRDRAPLIDRLGAALAPTAAPETTLADALARVTGALAERGHGRAVIILARNDPPPAPPPPAMLAAPFGPPAPVPAPAAPLPAPTPAPDDPALAPALESLRRSGATVHVVVLGADGPRLAALRAAAEATGGGVQIAPAEADLTAACRAVTDALTERYLIGYAPPHPERAGWRSLEVRVGRPGVSVQAPRGHFIE